MNGLDINKIENAVKELAVFKFNKSYEFSRKVMELTKDFTEVELRVFTDFLNFHFNHLKEINNGKEKKSNEE